MQKRREFPEVLKQLAGTYDFYNVETIGDNIIEVHLRQNHDPIQKDLDVCWETDEEQRDLIFLADFEDADVLLLPVFSHFRFSTVRY